MTILLYILMFIGVFVITYCTLLQLSKFCKQFFTLQRLRHIKLYRWIKGGRWVLMDGIWFRVDPNGMYDDFIYEYYHGFHFNYNGIEKREDYRSDKEIKNKEGKKS